jgi:hypothetical protein
MHTAVIIMLLGLTLLSLILGIVFMVIGGEHKKLKSNKMMFYRVGLQAITVIVLFIAAWFSG